MTDEPLISVIVPVYKAEKYLEECVRSITGQEYHNLEIILVDDGSPDRCPEICDELAAGDARIRVIHRENGGISVARNTGVDAATGEFIAFVDDDDVLHPALLRVLYEGIGETGADSALCLCQPFLDPDPPTFIAQKAEPNEVVRGEDVAMSILNHDGRFGDFVVAVWAKLIPVRFLREEGGRFPPGRNFEDVQVAFHAAYRSERIVKCSQRLYGKREHGSNVSAGYSNFDNFDKIRADVTAMSDTIIGLAKGKGEALEKQAQCDAVERALTLLRGVTYAGGKDRRQRYYPILRQRLMGMRKEALRNPYLSPVRKLELRALSIGKAAYVPMVRVVCGLNERRGLRERSF